MNRHSFLDELVKRGAAGVLRKVATEAPGIDPSPLPFSILVDPADATTRLPNSRGRSAIQPRLGTIEPPKEYIDEKPFNRARWGYGP